MDEEKLAEEDLGKLSPLVSDLRHEISTPLNVIDGNIELYRMGKEPELLDGMEEEEVDELEEFVDSTQEMIEHTELRGTLPEGEVDELQFYADRFGSGNGIHRQVEKTADVSADVLNYQDKLLSGENSERSDLQSLLKPLRNSADNMDVGAEFDYNGLEDRVADVDSGFRLLFWTLGKNWEEHAYGTEEDVEFRVEVSEDADSYVFDVWDTGEGFFNEVPGEDGKSVEHRYRKAYETVDLDGEGGRGLKMASNIAGVYDSEFFYSEEMLEEEGCGWRIRVPKYQSSTSESS